MMKYINIRAVLVFTFLTINCVIFAQEESKKINIEELTLEQMKGYTQEDLLQFSFEDLILLVKKFKLSSIDELYKLLLNPSQSTASKMEEDVFDAPLSTTVITSTEIERSGARSIPEALKLAPGVIVREKTNGNYDVHLRGNDFIAPGSDISNSVNSSTLVMIDDRPVYNNFLGATFWETLPVSINDLEKIEIVYGPVSALYGPNAVTGVIHLITKQVSKENAGVRFDLQAGTNNSQILYGSYSTANDKLALNISGNYEYGDRFQEEYYIPFTDSYVGGDEVGAINYQMDTTFNASSFSSDYLKAKQNGALNLSLVYTPTDKLTLDYMGSYQKSSVQTAYMDIGSILSTRESSSFSNSLNINYGQFDGHVSAVFGHLNAVKGLAGYEYDYNEINAKFGYTFQYKNLTIRPGVDANYAYYSDEDYINTEKNSGLLNGDAELGTVQGSLRLDYTAFDKLRIVGAWMQGYFYKPERSYNAYQFATSYKAGDNTLLRLAVSKANSSPFVLNTYMNKMVEMPAMDENSASSVLYKVGNTDLDLLEMRMYEVGIRQKVANKLQIDVSAFMNDYENYSQLVRNQQSMMVGGEPAGAEGTEPEGELSEGTEVVSQEQIVMYETIENLDLKARQFGVSANVKYIFNDKLNTSLFATYQHTTLEDYEVSEASFYEGLTGETLESDMMEASAYISIDHDYTPKFYGGASINYNPTKKWNFNASFYGYSKQKTFYSVGREFKWLEIDPKLQCNLKVNYNVNKWMDVYVNARNLTANSSREFIFSDKTGGVYLGGINIKF